jgi:hypothetical protein
MLCISCNPIFELFIDEHRWGLIHINHEGLISEKLIIKVGEQALVNVHR